jgi:hypothetical protein
MRALLVVPIVLVALAQPAGAQEARAIRKIEDANRAAMEDYDILNFESAKKLLEDALSQAKKARLEKHPVAAKTHVNLGIVLGGGMADLGGAQAAFKKAIEIDPAVKLPPAYRTPELQRVFDSAGPKGEEGPPVGIKHTPVDRAKTGEPIPLSVQLGPEVKAKQVLLTYRAAGTQEFTTVPMKPVGISAAEWTYSIPAEATKGDSIDYFIEAKGLGGKTLAATGNSMSPSTIKIDHGGPVTPPKPLKPEGPEPPEENPLLPKGGPAIPPGGGGGGDDPKVTTRSKTRRSVYVAVGVGSGAGFISGKTEVSNQDVTCCVAFAPFHVLPEIGFWLSPSFTLSVVGRLGLPLTANVPNAATAAPSGFVRATYRFGEDQGLYLHGEVGGGFIRHVVTLKRTSASGEEGQIDTFATGPLFVGGGTGYQLALGKTFRINFDLTVVAGIPVIKKIGEGGTAIEPGFAVHGDFTLGFGVVF